MGEYRYERIVGGPERRLVKSLYAVLELIAVAFAFAYGVVLVALGTNLSARYYRRYASSAETLVGNIAYQNHRAALCAGISAGAQDSPYYPSAPGCFE